MQPSAETIIALADLDMAHTKRRPPPTRPGMFVVDRDGPDRTGPDHRAAKPVFRDRGGSLVSDTAYPDAVVDMLKIAQHRGWSKVRVSGDETFKREVWIQAQALGLEVAGHRPRERDRQAAGLDRPSPSRDIGVGSAPRPRVADQLSRAAIVVARLVPNLAAQARLLERAWARAGRDRPPDRGSRPERSRDR